MGDILFTRKGTFGRSAVVESQHANCLVSSEIMRLRVDTTKVLPRYLSAYLNSRFGYCQVKRRTHGFSNFSISQEELVTIKIVIPPLSIQKAIDTIVEQAHKKQEESYLLYGQTEEMLLSELGMARLELTQSRWWTVPVSWTRTVHRLDAEYFQPRYQLAMNLMSRSGLQVKDIAKLAKRRFKPMDGVSFRYIEIGNLTADGFANSEEVMGENAPSRAAWIVRSNDVITSTVRPIRRLSAMIEREQDGSVCSSGFAVLEPKSIEPEILLVYLRLPIVCEILNLLTKASMYPAISAIDLLDIPITLPSEKVCQQIVDKVKTARQAHQEAKALLEEARRKVEALVEGERG